MSMHLLRAIIAMLLLSCALHAALPGLKVSDNHRFLVTEDGKPFFYLGDTAWELFHRATREEADRYLKNRAAKGFTVIQAVAIAEFDGLTESNAYGQLPFRNLDPTTPDVRDGGTGDYWGHVDYIVNKAENLGLYVGMVPTWGRYWHDAVKDGKPLFTEASAAIYGEWLGQRYKSKPIIWILGGDRKIENDSQRGIIRAMAMGLKKGDGGAHLITLHPCGGCGSSQWFHNESWLDFNMRQNGHGIEFTRHYDQTHADYELTPAKPVLDGEPIYEGHPLSFNADNLGHSLAADVRRAFYWDVFSGACGHSYGHHSIWQFYEPGKRQPVNRPLMPWHEALDQPGANQVQIGRRLILSRPYLTRVPDDSIVAADEVPTNIPGAGSRRFVATRDTEGTYAMIYVPVGKPFKVQLHKLSAKRISGWWVNPRDGTARFIPPVANQGIREFTPMGTGELLDWILVLDDATKNYPEPGKPYLH